MTGCRVDEPVGGGDVLDRIMDEQGMVAALLAAGHEDRRGLMQAGEDWLMEEALVRQAQE